MVTFIFNLWSNIWPKMLIFRDMAKKLIFWESRHKILTIFVNLGQEGPRNFSDTAKCSQWPHLYTTYEATYHLKCLFLEILPKNWFSPAWQIKISTFFAVLGKETNHFSIYERLLWWQNDQFQNFLLVNYVFKTECLIVTCRAIAGFIQISSTPMRTSVLVTRLISWEPNPYPNHLMLNLAWLGPMTLPSKKKFESSWCRMKSKAACLLSSFPKRAHRAKSRDVLLLQISKV